MATGETVQLPTDAVKQMEIQYVSDPDGNQVSVIVPIDLWREIESERETAHLLKSDAMKRRLLETKERQDGIPFEGACEQFGIERQSLEI